jgi:hypothetical protein
MSNTGEHNIMLNETILKSHQYLMYMIFYYIELERIQTRYPGIQDQIKEKIRINSKNWKKMKKRYYLTCIVIENILKKANEAEENKDEMKKSAIETFYNMFTDVEADLKKLLEKYTQKSKISWIFSLISSDITKAKKKTIEKSNEEFIEELVKFELFEGYDDTKEKIIDKFIDEYHKWKEECFLNNLQEILPRTHNNKKLNELNLEYLRKKKIIEKNMFEKICSEIETKYSKEE